MKTVTSFESLINSTLQLTKYKNNNLHDYVQQTKQNISDLLYKIHHEKIIQLRKQQNNDHIQQFTLLIYDLLFFTLSNFSFFYTPNLSYYNTFSLFDPLLYRLSLINPTISQNTTQSLNEVNLLSNSILLYHLFYVLFFYLPFNDINDINDINETNETNEIYDVDFTLLFKEIREKNYKYF